MGITLKLLVTGASGLVGHSIVQTAVVKGWAVIGQSRSKSIDGIFIFKSEISEDTDWGKALQGVDCVVHCAARVHQMKESIESPIDAYRAVNTCGTLNLARQAAKNGVKRFVFISSIKVNGEFTPSDAPFISQSNQVPTDPYGLSKYEAEKGLWDIAQETGLEVVVIRPPLVYGPEVKANFYSMMRWVEKGLPLPLGAIRNQRSLVFLDNLVDLILTCCTHPNAKGETFLVSDGYDVSTSQLLDSVSKAMGRPNRMLPIPMSWINFAARLIGKPQISQKICGNLQVDISHTEETLRWKPPYSFEYGIQKTVDAYLKSNTI